MRNNTYNVQLCNNRSSSRIASSQMVNITELAQINATMPNETIWCKNSIVFIATVKTLLSFVTFETCRLQTTDNIHMKYPIIEYYYYQWMHLHMFLIRLQLTPLANAILLSWTNSLSFFMSISLCFASILSTSWPHPG